MIDRKIEYGRNYFTASDSTFAYLFLKPADDTVSLKTVGKSAPFFVAGAVKL